MFYNLKNHQLLGFQLLETGFRPCFNAAFHTMSMRSTSIAPTSWWVHPSNEWTTPPAWQACTTPLSIVYCNATPNKKVTIRNSSENAISRRSSVLFFEFILRQNVGWLTSQTPSSLTSSGSLIAARSPYVQSLLNCRIGGTTNWWKWAPDGAKFCSDGVIHLPTIQHCNRKELNSIENSPTLYIYTRTICVVHIRPYLAVLCSLVLGHLD